MANQFAHIHYIVVAVHPLMTDDAIVLIRAHLDFLYSTLVRKDAINMFCVGPCCPFQNKVFRMDLVAFVLKAAFPFSL